MVLLQVSFLSDPAILQFIANPHPFSCQLFTEPLLSQVVFSLHDWAPCEDQALTAVLRTLPNTLLGLSFLAPFHLILRLTLQDR